MPLDAVTISALAAELKAKLEGGRIDKVQQPEKDMLLISLRSQGENRRLLIASGTGNARIHLTRAGFENPAEPPMFCMLMRKHLVAAHIISVSQPQFERMIVLELDSRDELGVSSRKKLVIEMIGRSSNIILVGQDGIIIDCMRRADFAGDALRRLLPGMIYRLPPKQDKADFFGIDSHERRTIAMAADGEMPLDKWLLASFSGLSPLICRELSYRCGEDYANLPEQMDALADTVKAGEFSACMLLEGGKPLDFSFMDIKQYGERVMTEPFESFSELLDAFYSRRDKAEQQRRRSHELTRHVKTTRDRVARKLAGQRSELQQTENREELCKMAELVTANIYRLQRGDRVLVCQDYYDEACPEISIALDPLKTPQQNAAALYKQYNKQKGAKKHLTILIEQNERQLDYLNSVLEALSRTETEKDISDIRRELMETGYIIPKKGAKPERSKPQAPHRFISTDSMEILVGRSNVQNDELTTKLARRTDYWFHTQSVHGSHVIVRCDGEEPPEATVEQAASLAVYYSQARDAGKTAVDYTMVKNVRKPSGALPGKVIYTNYRSIMAQADEQLIKTLK